MLAQQPTHVIDACRVCCWTVQSRREEFDSCRIADNQFLIYSNFKDIVIEGRWFQKKKKGVLYMNISYMKLPFLSPHKVLSRLTSTIDLSIRHLCLLRIALYFSAWWLLII